MQWAFVGFFCAIQVASAAASVEDRAVIGAMRHADPVLREFHLLGRASVSGRLDAVLMIGGDPWGKLADGAVMWGKQQTLGLFLQDRHNPGRVYLLDTERGEPNCGARVERIAETDAIVSCTGDGYERQRYQKFIYDPRAKALVSQFRYRPFSVFRVFPHGDGAIFIESDDEQLLAIEYRADREPSFRVLSEADARPWIARVHTTVGTIGVEQRRVIYIESDKLPPPAAIPPLPRTTYDQFAAARPRRVKDGYVRANTEIHDSIGPWKQEDGRIWFGKSFYDGEGSTGVGGFGYFDTNEHKLHMFAPPEIADWSVTALAVGPDAVWMGIAWLGEGSNVSGGLLRFDRESKAIRQVEFPDFAVEMALWRDQLLIGSDFGLGIVKDGRVSRYFVDRMSDGRYRVVEAQKSGALSEAGGLGQ